MHPQLWIEQQLQALRERALLREPDDVPVPAELIDAASNDYLGLGRRAVSRETVEQLVGASAGAGAARLVHGTFPEHRELEGELAEWLGLEAALVTSSAFAANVGVLPALGAEGGLIVSDELNHASVVDGCRLARARVCVVPHLDVAAVERALAGRRSDAPAWVITESYFSMDGDVAPLAELRAVCDRWEAGLIVDEAHAVGVFGPEGAGRCAGDGVQPDVLIGGFGKALGSHGGWVASSAVVRKWLWNRSRSFVFSTAPSPLATALTASQLRRARGAESERTRLLRASEQLRRRLADSGVPVVPSSVGPILPVVLGSNERALDAAEQLRAAGVLARAIRPPTVPPGTARLRITLHADWDDATMERVASALERACAS